MSHQLKLNLSFTTLTFYEWFVVSEPTSGANIDFKEAKRILETTEDHFRYPYSYISNRKSSCSYNPMIYREILSNESYLASIAIICTEGVCSIAAKTEVLFAANIKPFALFDNFENALVWSKSNLADILSVGSPANSELPHMVSLERLKTFQEQKHILHKDP